MDCLRNACLRANLRSCEMRGSRDAIEIHLSFRRTNPPEPYIYHFELPHAQTRLNIPYIYHFELPTQNTKTQKTVSIQLDLSTFSSPPFAGCRAIVLLR